jgi:hypothetical protein
MYRGGSLPSTNRPPPGPLQALAVQKQSEGAEHSCLPHVSFADGEGGGFRIGCQPLTNCLLASDSLPIETRRTRQGGTTCEQEELAAAWIPRPCQDETSPWLHR